MADDNIYGNTPTFLGAENLVKHPEKQADTNVLIYGVPWEGAVTWGEYTGCELAPKVIRLASARYSGYLPELSHIDVFEHLKLGDLGDFSVTPAEPEKTMNTIESEAKKIWQTDQFPIAFGGDHGITYPIVKALAEQTGKTVGIIHLDAHYDNNEHSQGDPYGRGAPFARLYETEGVVNQSLVHMGIHGPRNKPENGRLAQSVNAVTMTLEDIRSKKHPRAAALEAYELASKHSDIVYLSICSDVLDHAYNPGGPVDGNGLTSYELLSIVHQVASCGIAGMDYVEVYPQQDQNDFSSHFASFVSLYALAGHIRSLKQDED
ncbi:agmatinase family protein [Salisediminibacterium halotolerans]|uniref:Agmatinase n=1 Tax=Salisediminibacterium halotolerans TaxID=517425 RepID=A0A1H9TGU2_9BACI|nr:MULTISPECIES: agmatinase family protein [Salisediminibacterium]RLJ78399.1 agmatinase [Actinophytocola xinjiangensis]RPE85622.1 agmatinase [Salisediminibacterium halotolerans]TWG37375.1 agmatinase [Salisediminibacterium halotolerans]SER96069.1 agmatinase [Salisediminibacterium haloalkalitolerans]GEL09234.1 guanidinopropionase [Salisediminibacterium halotolerans]